VGLLVLAVAAPAAAYEEATVSDGGALTGVVRFRGPAPKLEPLAVTRNRDACGERKAPEALLVGPDGGVQGSAVVIEGVERGKQNGPALTLDTLQCGFVPHVAALMAGTRARVKNADLVIHHPSGLMGRSTVFNLALPHKEQVIDVTRRLTRRGVVRVLCGVHPHMSAWIIVHDNPYVATTDEHGRFRIDVIPPGTYTVTMWHEGFRPKGTDKDGRPVYGEPLTVTRAVTIAPGAIATADFEIRSRAR
jgi:hypothetical protein